MKLGFYRKSSTKNLVRAYSRQTNQTFITYLTSKARAIIPAAKGAEALVPVCLVVQL